MIPRTHHEKSLFSKAPFITRPAFFYSRMGMTTARKSSSPLDRMSPGDKLSFICRRT
jgi:hypothetical protein